MTKPNTRNNKDKHKGDKPEPELDQSIELDDSRDLEQTNQSMELEETVQEDMEPDIQIRLRDSEQENTMTDLDTSQENLSAQPNKQEEQEQRNTKPEPEPEIETPIATTSQGKRSTKRINYSRLHTGKKNPKTPKNQRTQGHHRRPEETTERNKENKQTKRQSTNPEGRNHQQPRGETRNQRPTDPPPQPRHSPEQTRGRNPIHPKR